MFFIMKILTINTNNIYFSIKVLFKMSRPRVIILRKTKIFVYKESAFGAIKETQIRVVKCRLYGDSIKALVQCAMCFHFQKFEGVNPGRSPVS